MFLINLKITTIKYLVKNKQTTIKKNVIILFKYINIKMIIFNANDLENSSVRYTVFFLMRKHTMKQLLSYNL